MRGTALEYLETTLLETIRRALWSFLEDTGKAPPTHRSRDTIVRDLLASEATIAPDLERLRRPSSPRGPERAERPPAAAFQPDRSDGLGGWPLRDS